jgi:methenyltetrahydrofolate cyclohydrolase
MKLIDLKLHDFINEVDSPSPAPGGGSVAATAASLGAALVRMVGHLTVGKKKFLALPSESQTEFNQTMERMGQIKERLLMLVDADTESFNQIMAAFQLPKDTPEQNIIRLESIQMATDGAIRVPFEVARLALYGLQNFSVALLYGNKNTLSDLGVGALMFYAGLEGAVLNIEINLGGLTDLAKVAEYKTEAQALVSEGASIKNRILVEIHRRLLETKN